VKKELYPQVNIQIGELKIKTEHLNEHVKLHESKDRKTIEISELRKKIT